MSSILDKTIFFPKNLSSLPSSLHRPRYPRCGGGIPELVSGLLLRPSRETRPSSLTAVKETLIDSKGQFPLLILRR